MICVSWINGQEEYCLSSAQILTSRYQSTVDNRVKIECASNVVNKKPRYEGDAHSRMCRRIEGHERANTIKATMMFWLDDYFIRDRNKQRSVPVAFVLTALKTVYIYRIGAYGWSGERNTNRGEQPWLHLKCTGVDVPRGGGVEVVPHSPSVWTERSAGVQHLCARKHVTSTRLTTSTTTHMQALHRGWCSDNFITLDESSHPQAPAGISTVHGARTRRG